MAMLYDKIGMSGKKIPKKSKTVSKSVKNEDFNKFISKNRAGD